MATPFRFNGCVNGEELTEADLPPPIYASVVDEGHKRTMMGMKLRREASDGSPDRIDDTLLTGETAGEVGDQDDVAERRGHAGRVK